jgi:hypothetical protein
MRKTLVEKVARKFLAAGQSLEISLAEASKKFPNAVSSLKKTRHGKLDDVVFLYRSSDKSLACVIPEEGDSLEWDEKDGWVSPREY